MIHADAKPVGFRRDLSLILSTFFAFFAFVLALFFNAASNITSLGIFNQTNADISNEYPVYITPIGLTFSTWGLIYLWQAAWLVFMLAAICINTPYGHLYMNPTVLTPTFYIFVIGNYTYNILWLFVFCSLNFWLAFFVLSLIVITLYVAAAISHKNIYDNEAALNKIDSKWVWCYRILVNNGLAFYATWVSVAAMINLAIALTYVTGIDAELPSNYALAVLTVILVVYFVLDVYVYEPYLRWTFSPYLQLAIALAGVLAQNWHYKNSTAVYSLILTIIGPGLMFLTKIIITVFKHVKEN